MRGGAIPEDKLAQVCRVVSLQDPGSVLLLCDDTLFGGVSEGFIVTASQFGFKAISFDPHIADDASSVELGLLRAIVSGDKTVPLRQ